MQVYKNLSFAHIFSKIYSVISQMHRCSCSAKQGIPEGQDISYFSLILLLKIISSFQFPSLYSSVKDLMAWRNTKVTYLWENNMQILKIRITGNVSKTWCRILKFQDFT